MINALRVFWSKQKTGGTGTLISLPFSQATKEKEMRERERDKNGKLHCVRGSHSHQLILSKWDRSVRRRQLCFPHYSPEKAKHWIMHCSQARDIVVRNTPKRKRKKKKDIRAGKSLGGKGEEARKWYYFPPPSSNAQVVKSEVIELYFSQNFFIYSRTSSPPSFFTASVRLYFLSFFSRFRLIDSGIVNTRNTAKPHFREKVEKESNCKKFLFIGKQKCVHPKYSRKKRNIGPPIKPETYNKNI